VFPYNLDELVVYKGKKLPLRLILDHLKTEGVDVSKLLSTDLLSDEPKMRYAFSKTVLPGNTVQAVLVEMYRRALEQHEDWKINKKKAGF